jgi:hypothetical protein
VAERYPAFITALAVKYQKSGQLERFPALFQVK